MEARLTLKDGERCGHPAGQQQDGKEFHGGVVVGSVFPGWGECLVLQRGPPGRSLIYSGVGMGSGNLVQGWTWEHSRFPFLNSLF